MDLQRDNKLLQSELRTKKKENARLESQVTDFQHKLSQTFTDKEGLDELLRDLKEEYNRYKKESEEKITQQKAKIDEQEVQLSKFKKALMTQKEKA